MSGGHTAGPWPWEYTSDGKRIVIGYGLVEGPHGYEVAEVYSDDCPREVAEANANLIAAAPDLFNRLENLVIGIGMGWDLDGLIEAANAAIAKARGEA